MKISLDFNLSLGDNASMTTKMKARFGGRLREARKAMGLTQIQLAKRARLGNIQVCRLELGQANPKADTLRRLARALGTTMERLWG